jgi:ribosomal protein S18 acetylase RimI-like enzyme
MPQLSPPGVAVQVREARPSDRRAVRAVLLAAYREYAAALPPAVFGPYLADILDLDARDRDGELLVAEHDRRVVGAVTFYEDAAAEGLGWPAGWAGLRALGVDPAARRLGAGRALMDACLERALAARAPVLCLHTAAFMTAAVAIYEAMGFRRVPAFDFDVPAGGTSPPVGILGYRLDLPDDNA